MTDQATSAQMPLRISRGLAPRAWRLLQQRRWRQRQQRRNRQGCRTLISEALDLLAFNDIQGDYVEFGCGWAETLPVAYRATRHLAMERQLWVVDSFEDIPPPRSFRDLHPRWPGGRQRATAAQFQRRCSRAGVPRAAYRLVRRPFEQLESDAMPMNIALAFVNCYSHSQVAAVLKLLEPRLKHGMILAFNHYFAYSRFHCSGDRSALLSLQSRAHGFRICPYRNFGLTGSAFVVEEAMA